MKKFMKPFVPVVLLLTLFSTVTNAQTSTTPRVDYTVTASPANVVKPVDSNAKANLSIQFNPSGSVSTADREPVDVVFVFDKSGSMDEGKKNLAKYSSAKNAMYSAIEYFKENGHPNDQFAFVPFSDTIEENFQVNFGKGSSHLNQIKSKVEEVPALGGTNYTVAINRANTLIENPLKNVNYVPNKSKHIIFLTDGIPTFSVKNHLVKHNIIDREKESIFWGYSWRWKYFYTNRFKEEVLPVYYSSTGNPLLGNVTWKEEIIDPAYGIAHSDATIMDSNPKRKLNELTFERFNQLIKSHTIEQVENLKKKDIRLHAIGFGDKQEELDYDYLQQLASVAGGSSIKASTSNVNSVFQQIAEAISAPSISTDVEIDVSKFNGKVLLGPNSGATQEGNKISVRQVFEFLPNQGTPSARTVTLPLEFKEKGEYTFDSIWMRYVDPKTKEVVSVKHAPVTIIVSDEAPPSIEGIASLEQVTNRVNSLYIYEKQPTGHHFDVNYRLTPGGLSNNVNGTVRNIKIIQPLPSGVSLVNNVNGVRVTEANGVKSLEISVQDSLTYSNGKFTNNLLQKTIKLKADWSLNQVALPAAKVEFTDSRFSALGVQVNNLTQATDRITSKVRLDWPYDTLIGLARPDFYLDGDASGSIQKTDYSKGSSVAKLISSENQELAIKPIKKMNYKPGTDKTVIQITYADDEVYEMYLVADFDFIEDETGRVIPSGGETEIGVSAKLTKSPLGKDVVNQIRMKVEDEAWTEWVNFSKETNFELLEEGLITVQVRSTGHFTVDETTEKTVTIIREVEGITVNPNPIRIELGKSEKVTITISPFDKKKKEIKANLDDITIASPSYRNGNGSSGGNQSGNALRNVMLHFDSDTYTFELKGEQVGKTYLTLTSNKDKLSVTVPIEVYGPKLEGMQFTKPSYTITEGVEIPVKSLLIFTPYNATNKELKDVISKNKFIKVIIKNNEYYIVGKDQGYSTVTAISKENEDITAKAVFEIVPENPSENNGEGKW